MKPARCPGPVNQDEKIVVFHTTGRVSADRIASLPVLTVVQAPEEAQSQMLLSCRVGGNQGDFVPSPSMRESPVQRAPAEFCWQSRRCYIYMCPESDAEPHKKEYYSQCSGYGLHNVA